jgi:hypothetical protein
VPRPLCLYPGCHELAQKRLTYCEDHHPLCRRQDCYAPAQGREGLCISHQTWQKRHPDRDVETDTLIGFGDKWTEILRRGKEIVEEYNFGTDGTDGTEVTLRQLFYRLVSEQLLVNQDTDYRALSHQTVGLRERGKFPEFIDGTREIYQQSYWDTAEKAMQAIHDQYHVDRTEGQEFQIWIASEKTALVELLKSWFGEKGLHIFATKGQSSHSLRRDVIDRVETDGRPALLFYVGDFDASGIQIYETLKEKTSLCWYDTNRLALNENQIDEYGLVPLLGKPKDPNAKRFRAEHLELHERFEESYPELLEIDEHGNPMPLQIEADALEPSVLRGLFTEAIFEDGLWDDVIYQTALQREREEKTRLDPSPIRYWPGWEAAA